MPATQHARIMGTVIRLTLTKDGEEVPVLIQEIHLDCPDCGVGRYQIAGHHLRAFHQFLGETIARYPDDCGEGGRIEHLAFDVDAQQKES